MNAEGNIRKMRSQFTSPVSYTLPLYDNLEENEFVPMNELVGQQIRLSFLNQINCVVTGEKIKKAFGEGMSYKAFISSPLAVESIIRPELSQAHLGIGLRDLEWEIKHDMQPHVVYLALTSGVKVGVTRQKQVPTRWIDQGAWKAIVLAETPYRQLAGLLEVAMKSHLSDKTDWRKMLTDLKDEETDLIQEKSRIKEFIDQEFHQYLAAENEILEIKYPVIAYPTKVKSLKLDKNPVIEKKLMGIRGQYLIFEDGTVINLRSHAGYKIKIEA